jgi:hypothetical protein
MTRQLSWLALFVLSATLTHCSSCKENVVPEGSLPPETQTGANTFGCKINDTVWVARRLGAFAGISTTYDPTYLGGTFTLDAADQKYRNTNGGNFDNFDISITHFNRTGIYNFLDSANINFHQETKKCEYVLQYPTIIPVLKGSINVKKFDITNRIVAGTFECIMYVKGCDTLKITEGRFDVKL